MCMIRGRYCASERIALIVCFNFSWNCFYSFDSLQSAGSADIYAEIAGVHRDVRPSTSSAHGTNLSYSQPDVVGRLNSVRSAVSDRDDTLPPNIPAHEVANMLVQRALDRKAKTKRSKFHKLSSFWRQKDTTTSDKSATASTKSVELYAKPAPKTRTVDTFELSCKG